MDSQRVQNPPGMEIDWTGKLPGSKLFARTVMEFCSIRRRSEKGDPKWTLNAIILIYLKC
jgi:hypothetical protein